MSAARSLESILALLVGPNGECWPAPGTANGNGYRRLSVEGRRVYAHRVAYEAVNGPIPVGTLVDHQCHNEDPDCQGGDSCRHRACWNPSHLRAVAHAENVQAAVRDVCKRGHPYVVRADGHRYCRECRMASRIARGETSGTGHVGERTHCPQGHPYDEQNTYEYRQNGGKHRGRACRTCAKERARARRAAR